MSREMLGVIDDMEDLVLKITLENCRNGEEKTSNKREFLDRIDDMEDLDLFTLAEDYLSINEWWDLKHSHQAYIIQSMIDRFRNNAHVFTRNPDDS